MRRVPQVDYISIDFLIFRLVYEPCITDLEIIPLSYTYQNLSRHEEAVWMGICEIKKKMCKCTSIGVRRDGRGSEVQAMPGGDVLRQGSPLDVMRVSVR